MDLEQDKFRYFFDIQLYYFRYFFEYPKIIQATIRIKTSISINMREALAPFNSPVLMPQKLLIIKASPNKIDLQ